MTTPDRSEARAREILRLHLENVAAHCADAVLSVILTGSLTTDCYTGDIGSDIDLIHVLHDHAPRDSRARVMDCIARTEDQTGRAVPIARCVYRLRDLHRPYPTDFAFGPENKDYLELPIELLRLKDCGRTVWGEDIIAAIDWPRREDVIACQELSACWRRQLSALPQPDRPPMEALPIRLMVQAVLVRALLDYYFATGQSCSSKAAVAARLRQDVPDYAFIDLAERCTRWRYDPAQFTAEDDAFIRAAWPEYLRIREGLAIGTVPRM